MKKTLVVLFIAILLYIVYIVCDNIRINKINDTKKNNYSETVKTIDNVNLYKKEKEKYIIIGKIKKDTLIYLEKANYKSDYYKLLDENYYIYYEFIKPSKEKINNITYLPFNSELTTTNSFKINNIEINESNKFNIYLKHENNFIEFNNQLFEINNKYIKEIKNRNNGTYADKIVVLNLINYTEEQLEYLKSYEMITSEQYKMWIHNEIELKDNSILLISSKKDESFNKYNLVVNNIDFDFNDINEVSTKDALNSYNVDNIDMDTLKKMLNKEKIVYSIPDDVSVPVLNYHFFYDSKIESCNETICLDTSKFEEQLKYLKDNNFKTLTMKEFIAWYYGLLDIPEKSVLLTIDDGAMGTSLTNGNKLIPLLEKYNLHATLFLVTKWWKPENYKSNNLDIQSHSYDLHKVGSCGTQNIKCLDYNGLYQDMKKSFDIVGSYDSFCFPFYVHNSLSTKVLIDLGVKVAFGGGSKNVTRNSYKYYLPRYPIYSNITLDQFINMVN